MAREQPGVKARLSRPNRRKIPAPDFFLMSNLAPLETGLPFVVWISVRGNARRAIRVMVAPRLKARLDELTTVRLLPRCKVIGKNGLSAKDLSRLQQWVDLNIDVLKAHWNGETFSGQAIEALRKV